MSPRRPSDRPARTVQSVEAIVEIAADLFARHGYDATSMQDIADAIGLHKSSLYHHVRSKEELLMLVAQPSLDRLIGSLDAAYAVAGTGPRERVLLAFHGAAEAALEDVRGTNIILALKDASDVGRRLQDARRDYDRRFAELVHAAQQAGATRGDIDPLLLTRLALGMINWLVVWYQPDGGFSPETVRSAVVALFDKGL